MPLIAQSFSVSLLMSRSFMLPWLSAPMIITPPRVFENATTVSMVSLLNPALNSTVSDSPFRISFQRPVTALDLLRQKIFTPYTMPLKRSVFICNSCLSEELFTYSCPPNPREPLQRRSAGSFLTASHLYGESASQRAVIFLLDERSDNLNRFNMQVSRPRPFCSFLGSNYFSILGPPTIHWLYNP